MRSTPVADSSTVERSIPPKRGRRAAEERGGTGIHLRYSYESAAQRGAVLDNPLFELLSAVLDTGSIRQAALALGTSYRYVWGSLRRWERELGEPLIVWAQGRPGRATPFAERLVWAERRARILMQPHIEALRSGLSQVIAQARDPRHQPLKFRASHDIALPALQQHAAAADLHLEIGFQGSVDALRALGERHCLVAGFHVPRLESAASAFAKVLRPLIKPESHALIGCFRRTQGLMMRREHAARATNLNDVARLGMRFVNRQPSSGTRMLVDHLMGGHRSASDAIPGYADHIENTHVAVALCIASGVADAGVGIEAAALEFGLHFVPLVEEHYFLACLKDSTDHPGVRRLRALMADARWAQILSGLPGYGPADHPGRLPAVEDVLPRVRGPRRFGVARARR